MKNDNIDKPVYALINSGVFGFSVVSGIVTGVLYTENEPVYTIQFGKNLWTSSNIAHSPEELIAMLKLPSLERIKETHGLIIKYKS